jgi:hypothetical protein
VLAVGYLPAYASFEGQVVKADYLAPDVMSIVPNQIRPDETCVGPGVEFFSGQDGMPIGPVDHNAIDLSGTNIVFSNAFGSDVTFDTGGGTFNGFQLSDVDGTIPDITGVTVNAATTLAGFTESFDANNVRLSFPDNFVFGPADIVSLDVTFAGPPPPPAAECAVAAPSLPTAGLFFLALSLGLIGLFALRSRSPGWGS